MTPSVITRNYSGLKDNKVYNIKQLSIVFILIVFACGPATKKMSEMDYNEYTVKRDEALANKSISEEKRSEIVEVQNSFGVEALIVGDLDKAESMFNKTLEINQQDKYAKYGLAMIAGHRLYKKGSKTALWDALEHYGKATYYNPNNGEPHYWMGRSYEKKDDGDYELIIETYENALKGTLPDEIRQDSEERLASAKKKQKTFEDFWQ